ncbi:hypothetical protein JCM1840_001992 [Sporobolomyces johnsonii]
MGGGPTTPPDFNNIASRSSDDLVEVSIQPRSTSTTTSGDLTPTAGVLDPRSAVASSASGTASSSSADPLDAAEDEGQLAELLWSKSAVYLHPTPYGKDNLAGFLSIVRVPSDDQHLVSWIPEVMIEGTRDFEAYVLVELSSQNERDILVHLAPPATSPLTPSSPSSPRSRAFSYPLTSLYSLQVHPPTLTSWVGTVTISLFGGLTLPTLYFHDDESKSTVLDQDRRALALGASGGRSHGRQGSLAPSWGGEALLAQMRQHVRLVKSELDPSVFLVNPSKVDLEAHQLGIWDGTDDAVPNEALRGVRARVSEGERGERQRDQQARTSILHRSSPVNGRGGATDWPDDLDAPTNGNGTGAGQGGMDNLTFSVLSGFSRITRSARTISQQAASTVLSHPLAKPLAKHVPKPIAQFALAPGEVSRLAESAGVGVYDGARVYLAKWARIVAEEGERARKAEYGVDDSSLLEEEGDTGVFEILAKTYKIDKPRSTRAPKTPISLEEWHAWFDADDGKLLLDEAEAKRRVFQRGLADDETRKEVWPFLLKVYPFTSTREERKRIADEKRSEYERVKRRWMEDDELQKTDRFQEEDHRVDIDCRRTDRTHPLFCSPEPLPGEPAGPDAEGAHPPSTAHVRATHDVLMTWVFAPFYPPPPSPSAADSSATSASTLADAPAQRDYVQGMSDLFSPLYVVLDGEQWLAFSCFEEVMNRHADNFRMDQSGMQRQLSELQSLIRVMDRGLYRHLDETGSLNLFFCFRWILCNFKREFTFDQTVQLWEILWTDHLGSHFHLFIALAILEANRDVMIRYLREFDEILKYIVELSQTLDLTAVIADAEVLYKTFQQVVLASTPAPSNATGEGLRRRGKFPPSEEDAEEARREKVRERTRREIEDLRELLE